jgi:hypothetical protein
MTTPTDFEERLLHQLREAVAQRPEPTSEVAAFDPRAPRRRNRLILSGAGIAAAATVAAVVVTGDDAGTDAYAVTPQSDGSVTVQIHSLRDAAGLQRELRAAGVPAIVNYRPAAPDAPCAPPGSRADRPGFGTTERREDDNGPSLHSSQEGRVAGSGGDSNVPPPPAGADVTSSEVSTTDDGVTFTIDPGATEPGDRIRITTADGTMSSIGIATGDAAGPCGAARSRP